MSERRKKALAYAAAAVGEVLYKQLRLVNPDIRIMFDTTEVATAALDAHHQFFVDEAATLAAHGYFRSVGNMFFVERHPTENAWDYEERFSRIRNSKWPHSSDGVVMFATDDE